MKKIIENHENLKIKKIDYEVQKLDKTLNEIKEAEKKGKPRHVERSHLRRRKIKELNFRGFVL